MNTYFEAGFAQNVTNYNCSIDGKTAEYWEHAGTVNKPIGVAFITFGGIVELAYMVVIMAMLRPELFKLSCYKIMVLLGFYDMAATAESSLMTGYFFYIGSVYCRFPDWNYITGTFSNALWCGACLTALILVCNRVLELWKPHLMDTFFGGSRMIIWFVLPLLYTLFFIMIPRPIMFNSNIRSWFFDPFIRADETYKYHNYQHSANNLSVCILTPILYCFMCYVLLTKFKASNRKITWTQVSTIFQSIAICSANLAAGIIFEYMNYFSAPMFLIFTGQLLWMTSHAVPVVVYLTFNKTLQREIYRMFTGSRSDNTKSSNTQNTAEGFQV